MSEVISTFDGTNRFLSNFFPVHFIWAGIQWKTAEHAYQAAKATGSDKDEWIDKIIRCKTPGEAKRLGKKVPLRPKWDEIKIEMMRRIVRQKFVQNPSLLRKLISTGNTTLQEGNNWEDNFWGMCPPENKKGLNWLGKILMEIREEFKDFKDLPMLAQIETFDQLEEVETTPKK